MSMLNKDSVFTFSTNAQLWVYWVKILPQIAYRGKDYSHHELIDEAVLFACECLTPPPATENGEPRMLQFRRDLWNKMTGFEDILTACYSFSELLENQIDELRTRSIYMETGLRARTDHLESQESQAADPPSTGIFETARHHSATLDDIKMLQLPFMSSLPVKHIRAAYESSGCRYLLDRQTTKVKIRQSTMFKLSLLLDAYKIKPTEAILTVMSLVQAYLPMIEGYTDSLTEDLISRRLSCEQLAEKCHELLSRLETHCNASAHYTLLMAERLSTLGHSLSTGQTLLDKFLDELTLREDLSTDFSKYTDLDRYEQLWGKHAL